MSDLGRIPTASNVRTRPTVGFLNRLIDGINRSGDLDPGQGLLIGRDSSGRRISLSEAADLFSEAATIIDVVNTDLGNLTLPAFTLAGIEESFDNPDTDTTDLKLQNRRILTVRQPINKDAGHFAILIDTLVPNRVGRACIAGTCLVVVQRWFNDAFLDRADVLAGNNFAHVNVQGALQLLWEQVDANGNFIIDEDHFAIARFTNDYQPFKIINGGSTTIPFGTAGIPATASGVNSAGLISLEEPDVDSARSVYAVVGGDIPSGQEGRAIFAGRPFLARVDLAPDVELDTYGTEDTENEFRQGQSGFLPLVDLGTHDGEDWAVLHAAAPFLTLVPDATFVDEANPDVANHPAGPEFLITDGGGSEKWAIWKFPSALPAVQLLVTSGLSASTQGSGGTGSIAVNADFEFALIDTDFDITLVTWNNRPTGTSFPTPIGTFRMEANGSGGGQADSSFGSGNTVGIRRHTTLPIQAPVGKKWFGFFFRPTAISVGGPGGPSASATGTFVPPGAGGQDAALVAAVF